jgi:uncharacterized membrane protein (UPF0127 family)
MAKRPLSRLVKTGFSYFIALFFGIQAYCQDQGRDRFIKVFLPDGKSITAELAVSDEERARGLMFRKKVLPEQGMLFVFEREDVHSFWMKNTLVALDMLWLDSEKQVVYVAADVPPCTADPCPSYGPDRPARYVLELASGRAEASGIKVGVRLQFILPKWVLKDLR